MSTEIVSQKSSVKAVVAPKANTSKDGLRAQLQKEAAERRRAHSELAANEAINALINKPRLLATSLPHLCELLVECHKELAAIVKKFKRASTMCATRIIAIENVSISAKLLNPTQGYSRQVSPQSLTDRPSGMFFNGTIQVVYARTPDFFDSTFEMFAFVHRGTGGGNKEGKYRAWNELTLALDDFPLMLQAFELQRSLEADEVAGEKVIQDAAQKTLDCDPEYARIVKERSELEAEAQSLRDQLSEVSRAIDPLNNAARSIAEESLTVARTLLPNAAKAERHRIRSAIGLGDARPPAH